MAKQLKTKSLSTSVLGGLGKGLLGLITLLIVVLLITFTIHQLSLKMKPNGLNHMVKN